MTIDMGQARRRRTSSEARRGLVRMTANYGRLLLSVCLGLVLVRVLLLGVGNDGWGLIVLLGATIGFAAMFQEIVRASLIRELGEAHHGGDDDAFGTVYNSALAVTAVVAFISTGVILALLLVLPVLRIPEELLGAARWMVIARAAESFVFVLLVAPFNMYLVTERMVTYNLWLTVFRAAPVAAAAWLFVVQDIRDPARGITLFALSSSALFIALHLAASGAMIARDRRLWPSPGRARRAVVRRLLAIGGWNLARLTSTNLHVRADNVIMNLFFGLFGNTIFGLTTTLTAYVRTLTTGVTFGLDAVSARLSTAGGRDSVQRLCRHSTRLHGLVAFPAAVAVLLLAEPILVTWLGDRIQDRAATVPPTVTLIHIMTLGMACRAVSDGWATILYGSGHVARYAPLFLIGGVANPVIAVLLILTLPDGVRYTGAAWSYTVIFAVVHMGLLPRLAAPLLDVTVLEILAPLWRPLTAAALCAPILLLALHWVEQWDLLRLALVGAIYGGVYGVLSILFVLDGHERRRLRGALRELRRR